MLDLLVHLAENFFFVAQQQNKMNFVNQMSETEQMLYYSDLNLKKHIERVIERLYCFTNILHDIKFNMVLSMHCFLKLILNMIFP